MKIIVVHGDNEIASRKRLNTLLTQAKERGLDIRNISQDSKTPLVEAASIQGLFGESVLVVENPGKYSKKEIQGLFRTQKTTQENILFFQSGFLTKGFLGFLPEESVVEEFKLPKVIYKFLDSFYPSNVHNSLTLLHLAAKNEPEELILHLLSRHLRDLYLLKIDPKSLDYPEWRILKLANQGRRFSPQKIASLINKLAEIDVSAKTSKESLISSLDLLIVTELE